MTSLSYLEVIAIELPLFWIFLGLAWALVATVVTRVPQNPFDFWCVWRWTR